MAPSPDIVCLGEPLIAVPYLGGDEEIVPIEPAGRDRLPDTSFIAVHRGGVDMAVARGHGRQAGLGHDVVGHLPDAEPDLGDVSTVVQRQQWVHAPTVLRRAGPGTG